MDEVWEISKRDSAKGWILRNALPYPNQLEFKVDPLEAADMNVDITGVGTHGRGAMYPRLMGSVTEEVIYKPRYPVLVVMTHEHK